MNSVAVLIPCYNEELTVGKVVADWKKRLPDSHVYVYDNNSTDNSIRVALEAGATVYKEFEQGKGNVIRAMFNDIKADCYILVDADDTYSANKAEQFVESILTEKYDMVIGDRLSSTYFNENKRLFHNLGNIIVRYKINRIYGSDIKDVLTGLRAFSNNFVSTFKAKSNSFEIETEMTAFALENNLRIKHISVDYKNRPIGSVSKLSTFSDGIKILKYIHSIEKGRKTAV